MDYLKCVAGQCVFYKRAEGRVAILAIYVDDMLLTTNSGSWKRETLEIFEENFKMKINTNPTCFLGVDYAELRNSDYFFVSQVIHGEAASEILNGGRQRSIYADGESPRNKENGHSKRVYRIKKYHRGATVLVQEYKTGHLVCSLIS